MCSKEIDVEAFGWCKDTENIKRKKQNSKNVKKR